MWGVDLPSRCHRWVSPQPLGSLPSRKASWTRCLMVCHSKFYTHVDIVYVLYGNTDPYRKWPDGTYRIVMLVCSKYMSLVHIARMSMACFPVPLYSQERKKKRCVEVSPSPASLGCSPRHAEGRHACAFKGRKTVKMKAISFPQWPGQMP